MEFTEWLYSSYPNPVIDGKYGTLHVATLLLCLLTIVISTLLVRNRSDRCKRAVLIVFAAGILLFELVRRAVGLTLMEEPSTASLLYTLLPRPGCAISCWLILLTTVINRRFMYNVTAIFSILCGLAFLAHPAVGFNNEYILFENLYSIVTHFLLFTSGVCYVTFGFTRFTPGGLWKDLLVLAAVSAYTYWEVFVIKIERDPFYFMSGNEVQTTLGLPYEVFLACYIAVISLCVSAFYFIQWAVDRRRWA